MQIAIVTDLATARGALDLKAAATMYDLIVVVRTLEGKLDQQCQQHLIRGSSTADIDWLQENGIILFIDEVEYLSVSLTNDEIRNISEYRKARYGEFLLLSSTQYEKMALAVSSFVARYLVAKDMIMMEGAEADFVPMTFTSNYSLDIGRFFPGETLSKPGRGDIGTAIITKHIKIPDEQTSWQDIVEFRGEEINRWSRTSLRRFIRQLSQENPTISEIQEEIEQDMALVKRKLDLSKLSFRETTLQAVVVGGVSFVEKCAKFEIADLVEKFFSIRSEQTELLEIELEFAQRNTYYILKANETFALKAKL